MPISEKRSLLPHPSTPAAITGAVTVSIARVGDCELQLMYLLDIPQLVLPPPRELQHDPLWKHTCCELFVADALGLRDVENQRCVPYREFNFSPNGAWAAYDFVAYRHDPRSIDLGCTQPRITLSQEDRCWQIVVTLSELAFPKAESGWRLGLAVVAETISADFSASHACSYWAIDHVHAKPDFHEARTWALYWKSTL